MGRETLVIRADADERMGTGHIMRCIALAHAWQETGGQVAFLISPNSSAMERVITGAACTVTYLEEKPGSVADADATCAYAAVCEAAWIVADGYHFTGPYQKQIKYHGKKLLLIDDYSHSAEYVADIVLNQNPSATMDLYPKHSNDTRFLLGGKFTLLRKEFLVQKTCLRKIPSQVTTLLVTMGGSDPDNVTYTVCSELKPLISGTNISVSVVIGRMNTHYPSLVAQFGNEPWCRFILAPENMPVLIRRADIAITGAGTTAWELAYLGTPMITITLCENQKLGAELLEKTGSALSGGDLSDTHKALRPAVLRLINDSSIRQELSLNAMKLIDGQGAARVVMQMKNARLRLRSISREDCRQIWEWANDPGVRRNAFEQEPIDLKSHEQWFIRKLRSPDSFVFIAIDQEDRPVGQIRFDRSGTLAEVDISIDRDRRNSRFGGSLLKLGLEKIFHVSPITSVTACVKADNRASQKMFERAGFQKTGNISIKGSEVICYTYPRPHYSKDT
jgi:UDP-2,4-diacetamido-2,4,6-trideoxy-beta-L-altropyranose hydrolase